MLLLASDAYRITFRYAPVVFFFVVVTAILSANVVPPLIQFLIDYFTGRDNEAETKKSRSMEGRLFSRSNESDD